MKEYNKRQFDLRILIDPWYLQTLLILVIDRKKNIFLVPDSCRANDKKRKQYKRGCQ
jgi:hypothetical protein